MGGSSTKEVDGVSKSKKGKRDRDGERDREREVERHRDRKVDRVITSDLDKDRETDGEVVKLLLLGPGDSGKSTVFKQLINLHGKGFDEKSRMPYKSIVYTNTILSIKTLIRQSAKMDECHWGAGAEAAVKAIKDIKDFSQLDDVLARQIRKVWSDPGIRRTYSLRSKFQLADECKWFFERIEELGKPEYIPSYQDILRCRARTTGIVETAFTYLGTQFRILDVGGQRNERKKWFHCFEHVTAVIFVAAINEYDQVLYEDGLTNRIHESLDLFGEICNSRWFKRTPVILFLNKLDLFKEKLSLVDLKLAFPDFDGGSNFEVASEFLKREFTLRNEKPATKKVYVHFTCAMDKGNIQLTFQYVRDIVVKTTLKASGMI